MPNINLRSVILSSIQSATELTQPQEEQADDLVEKANQVVAALTDNPELRADPEIKGNLVSLIRDRQHPEIKKVETSLRNLGVLDREVNPDYEIIIQGQKVPCHRSVLEVEVPGYFGKLDSFMESQRSTFEIKDEGLFTQVVEKTLEYLYLSNEKRAHFISSLDKRLLVDIAGLADMWELDLLKNQCDEELCNSIGGLDIEKKHIPEWLSQDQIFPKFSKLLAFIYQMAGKGEIADIIDQLETFEGALQLASECTPEEKKIFKTLVNTELGKAVFLLGSTFFGKREWETHIGDVGEVPPLPENIIEILQEPSRVEGKNRSEAEMLVLIPKTVDGKPYTINLAGEIFQHPKQGKGTKYQTYHDLIQEVHGDIPVKESYWVLISKDILTESKGKTRDEQIAMASESNGQRAPKLIEAITSVFMSFVCKDSIVFGTNPFIFTCCQEEPINKCKLCVGCFDSSGLFVTPNSNLVTVGVAPVFELSEIALL